MFKLVPDWAKNYEEFWEAVKLRNYWFIKLRYFAAIALFILIKIAESISFFSFSEKQKSVLIILVISILIYNLVLHNFVKQIKTTQSKFNALHYSLLQMILDLLALTVLVYYTGGIHSPFLNFYIFHMIIGSLILPGHVVYTISICIILVFTGFQFLHFKFGSITYSILESCEKDSLNIYSMSVKFISFSSLILVSVFLANHIAKRLYRREKELKETLDKLKDAEKAKQKYIVGIVHEIKSPIAAVKSLVNVVYDELLGKLPEQVKEKLGRVLNRSDEALNMINDILKYSKLKLLDEINKEDIDVENLLNEILQSNETVARSKSISLKINRKDKFNLKGDLVLLKLAFSNLIGNSIKYGNIGGRVEIDMYLENSKKTVMISDDGQGIDEVEKEKIFNQFYRSRKNKESTEGSGMGLSLVKEIIEMHEGKIEVIVPSLLKEKKGKGITIKLLFN